MAKKTLLDSIIESVKRIDDGLDKQDGAITQAISDLNYKVVEPAKSAADSAVAYANDAIEKSKVNSQAIDDINSAVSDAKQGANDAMSRALSAWDVATGAKEAVTDFDPLLKSAQSDASKALTQIADTASALSDAKTAFNSDVAEAKNLANTAQTTANSAVESASENAKELASQANALSDARKAMDSGIANAKELANAAQTTADNAVKSASSVADDLTKVASQAKANADGITKVTSDVGLLQTTVADNSGNISTIQETAKQIQQAVSDNSGAIVVATQTAQGAATVASDAKSNATVAVQTASGASVTAENAQGDAATAIVTAKGAVTQASDAKSNATIAVQTASEASLTATNAQGDASIAKQTASEASLTAANAKGDISKLQTRAGTIEASVANNSGAIADVQATANQLKASVSDNSGAIVVATQTAQGAATVASDAKSNATVAIQTASQASITAKNASGQAASAVLTANGALTTASNAKSDATVAIQTASGASLTATNAKDNATVAKQTASEAKVQASNAESDFAQLSIRAGKIEASVATNSGAIASVQQTANGLTTTVADIKANGGGVNLVSGTDQEYVMGYGVPNTVWQDGYAYLKLPLNTTVDEILPQSPHTFSYTLTKGTSYTQTIWFETDAKLTNSSSIQFTWFTSAGHDLQPATLVNLGENKYKIYSTYMWPGKSNNSLRLFDIERLGSAFDLSTGTYLKFGKLMLEEGTVAHTWSPAPEDLQNQFTQTKQSIDGLTTTINDPKTGLNTTYQIAAGNAITISNVKSDVYQLQTTANGLTSRVGNLESKTNTQQTAIEQNKNAITLKADQTAVDKINGTVSQLQSTLTVQAGQIQEKVTSSQVTGMLAGYATQDYTQSLVTQKANDWNLNLTNLKTDVNAIKTNGGGVNLLQGTRDFEKFGYLSKVAVTNGQDQFQAVTGTFNSGGPYYDIAVFYNLPLKKDTDYTASFWVKTSENVDIISYLFDSGSNGNYADGATVNHATTDYTRFVVHFHNGNNTATPSFIPARILKTGVTVWLYGCMLEEGTVAHTWSPAPSDMATVTAVTNLAIGVEGVQAQVYNSDGSSKITQLSNLIATKVSQGDYNSQITQLQNDINQRVQVGDVISQINQEAGGDTLIQVSNGKKSLILDAGNTIFTGKAWIPSAAISNIQADQVQIGDSRLFSDDGTLNLINQNAGTASIKLTTGNVQGSTQPVTKFANGYNTSAIDISPVGTVVRPTLFFEDYPGQAKDNGWLGFSRHQTAELYFHTYDDTKELFRVACVTRFNQEVHVDRPIWQQGLSIASGNTIWSGSDYLAIGDHLSNSYTNVMARAFSSQSTLSSKTNIETVDPKDALDLVNRTDIRSYQYKADVAQGKTKRYTSLIIDDVNDVSQYYAPDEFTNEERTGRDDGSAVGYLFLAIQELTRRIKTLEEKLNG